MKKKKNIILILPLLVISLIFRMAAFAAKENPEEEIAVSENEPPDAPSNLSFKGQFKEFYTQIRTDDYSETGREKLLVADLKRLRLSPELNLSEFLLIHVDYDNEIITGSYLKSREFDEFWRPSRYNDLFRPEWESRSGSDLYYSTGIHRAYAKITAGSLTATLGRQLVRFGSGRLWNPLDILNPVSPTSFEGAEDQKGIDALRLEYYVTKTMELSLVLDQKRKHDSGRPSELSADNSNIVARLKTTIGETEIAVLGGRVSRRRVGGVDVSAVMLDGMLRGAALYSDPEEGKPFLLGSAGYEYNFAMGLYALVEYFYNRNGLNFNARLRSAYAQSLMTGVNEENFNELSNQFLTYNRHYAGLVLGYDINALLRAEFFSVYDFQGRGLLLNPSLKYNAFQNIDVTAGTMIAHVFKGSARTSDFRPFSRGGLVYASLAWYF
jgi:hypothetical protein